MSLKNPYEDDKGNPLLLDSFCVFMDILGFRQLTIEAHDAGGSEGLLNSIHKVMTRSSRIIGPERLQLAGHKEALWQHKIFTDNIVLGYPTKITASGREESDFGSVILEICEYQLLMAVQGFFIRGGFSIGPLHVGKDVVFGKALIDAHELESVVAVTPRVVISENVMELVRKHLNYYKDPKDAPQNRHILRDTDNQYFVNYLTDALIGTGEVDSDYLRLHRVSVEKALKKYVSFPKIWEKYLWVANYHDYFCSLIKDLPGYEKDHLIESSLKEQKFSRLV